MNMSDGCRNNWNIWKCRNHNQKMPQDIIWNSQKSIDSYSPKSGTTIVLFERRWSTCIGTVRRNKKKWTFSKEAYREARWRPPKVKNPARVTYISIAILWRVDCAPCATGTGAIEVGLALLSLRRGAGMTWVAQGQTPSNYYYYYYY